MLPTTSAAKPFGNGGDSHSNKLQEREILRPAFVWLALFMLLISGSWAVYHFQFESLPTPLDAEQAGEQGFSEVSAMEHVKFLASLGPHSVGSDALDVGLQYVLAEANKIKEKAHGVVDVQVDFFEPRNGANRLSGGLFRGKSLVYSGLKHVLLRVSPKHLTGGEHDAILVSAHLDTVFAAEGAGDDTSSVAVMLELARGISQSTHDFKNSVVFFFNTGEEEGLTGAHSFITQHPWSTTIRYAVDLEAMGIGGKSSIFQSGPESSFPIETFAKTAKYPSGQVISQDLFGAGILNSGTDFQVYKEVGHLSGLDFAFTDSTAVYHTKNDKLKLLKAGSLQHLGENKLPFLVQIATSADLAKLSDKPGGTSEDRAIYFDVLGVYMVVYPQHLATMIQISVIILALLIWAMPLLMGGISGAISFGLACLSIALMWIFSLSFSAIVAFILPHISFSPIPYIANPWMILGLFGAPALLGAFAGQHIGFYLLQKYLQISFSNRILKLHSSTEDIKSEAERWLFKSGFVQWFVILVLGHYFEVRSTYLALIWFASPATAYILMEATLTPTRPPKQLRDVTLVMGLTLPVLISSGITIRIIGTLIGNMVRFDRNPGNTSETVGNLIVAIAVAVVVCLFLVYVLSYIHNSGAKGHLILFSCALLGLSLAAVYTGVVPAYTDDISRTLNVVHVVETTGTNENQTGQSYISLFSSTPGTLTDIVENIEGEEFTCGNSRTLDLVTFTVKYGCWSSPDTQDKLFASEIPILNVESDHEADVRKTKVMIDTKISHRWALAINTEYISDFSFEVDNNVLVPEQDEKISVDGWHKIQFAGGKDSPTKFYLNLVWANDWKMHKQDENSVPLLKLRTDVNQVTPKVAGILKKLPSWCTLFGKSTAPFTLAFLSSLPVDFESNLRADT